MKTAKKKKELTRGPNPPRPASTRGLCGAGYAGQIFFTSWKYQPTPPKSADYAGQPDGFDPFYHLYLFHISTFLRIPQYTA